mmetsp:Transcript_36044/g.43474  ORF Transcript_36044/g.43474 Transcript_36044/m.43474 type:complete len:175 (-) Transcript_36044:76-600(-)|eukprot:CAMPEP_0197855392 /NCGR_PEP_ID=MMETSP1438-20131217/26558_1 /TAXON_ID=1461541 /ORGANISM="Pterosperma sp., Strain CCMP1384" /LENGTH=174 /DNA_ID=CAMNT_0043470483 /DNA_START=246 /DNA_END=770 /DNA_ORIENTATION=+
MFIVMHQAVMPAAAATRSTSLRCCTIRTFPRLSQSHDCKISSARQLATGCYAIGPLQEYRRAAKKRDKLQGEANAANRRKSAEKYFKNWNAKSDDEKAAYYRKLDEEYGYDSPKQVAFREEQRAFVANNFPNLLKQCKEYAKTGKERPGQEEMDTLMNTTLGGDYMDMMSDYSE